MPRVSRTVTGTRRPFDIEVGRLGDAIVRVRVTGDLDPAYAVQFEHAMRDALDEAPLVVVDLRDLDFCDSSAVRALLEADSRAREAEKRMVVVPAARVRRVLEAADADRALTLVSEMDDRLHAMYPGHASSWSAPIAGERIPHLAAAHRTVNGAVRVGRRHLDDVQERRPYLCECGLLGCNTLIELTAGDYERARSDPRWFAVLPGHEIADVQTVVARGDLHCVVEDR